MVELNIETANKIIDVLEFTKKIYEANPNIDIPLAFLSPSISKKIYGHQIQLLNYPLFYIFTIASIVDFSSEEIKDGESILDILMQVDECFIESLYFIFIDDNIDYHDLSYLTVSDILNYNEDEATTEIKERRDRFIAFLSEEMIVKTQFKIPFINKYSDNVEKLLSYIIQDLIYDIVGTGGERVLEYFIDKDTCMITVWSITEGMFCEQEWDENEEHEDIFLDILRDEAL